jgi:hypothetical protein
MEDVDEFSDGENAEPFSAREVKFLFWLNWF